MSDAQARQRAIDYMVGLLQMNPIHEGDEIIRTRSKALGLAKKNAAITEAVSEPKVERRKLIEQLDAIRAEFWTMPIEALHAQLSELNAGDYADLQAAVTRLSVVAAHRGEFPKLAQKPGFDGEFFSSLKEVLIRSPRDTAVLREQVLSTFRNRARCKSGRKMVELLKKEMPSVYELETAWFETLRRQKSQVPTFRLTSSASRARPAAIGAGSGAGRYWWLLAILGSSALRAIFSQSDHNSNSSRYQPSQPIEIKDLPPDVRRMIESGDQRARDIQGQPFPEFDRDMRQSYGQPIPPESRDRPTSRSPIKIDRPFGQPKIFDSDGTWKKSDDGFPR